jgi:hemerythrin
MAIISWNDDYSVKVEELDNQHKVIISLINKLNDLYVEKKFSNTDAAPILKELSDYADSHFNTEEYYFKLYNYEKAAEHIAMHQSYREKVDAFKKEYAENPGEKVFYEINNFLNDWWIWHINNADKQYSDYFNQNGLR